jgi:helicase
MPRRKPRGLVASFGSLREVLARGIAFHNSHLDSEERRVIEDHFRRRDTRLRVNRGDDDLTMGVNTPASAVVTVGLELFPPIRRRR